MKKIVLLILVFYLRVVEAQQFRLGIDFIGVQTMEMPLNSTILLDTILQGNRLFKIDHITQKALSSDIPDVFASWHFKNNWFVKGAIRFSLTKMNVGVANTTVSTDTIFTTDTWNLFRQIYSIEGGYLFGKKMLHPYFTFGFYLSKLQFMNKTAKFYGYNDYDAINYYNYFLNSPAFIGYNLRLGIKRKIFSLSLNFTSSLTKIDSDKFIKRLGSATFELGWDIYRSKFIAKKQFTKVAESNEVNLKTKIDLKKQSSATGLHFMYSFFTAYKPYVDSYSDSSSNILIRVNKAPQQSYLPELFGNHIRAFGERKQIYTRTEYGVNFLRLTFKDAKQKTATNGSILNTQGQNELLVNTYDIQQSYLRVFYSYKAGYRIKFQRKSFIYGEAGLRYMLALKNYRDPTELPYLKKSQLWLNIDGGLQFGHKGISAGVIGTLGKPDHFNIFKNIATVYIGIYHEISSK